MYPPADEESALPRLSSPNLTDEQVGEPALEVVLEPGDLLYFPRCDLVTVMFITYIIQYKRTHTQ